MAYRQDSNLASAGSSLVLISSQTASTSATLDFTGLTTYSNLLVVFQGVCPVTNATVLQMLMSSNNGSTWMGAGNYNGGINYHAYTSTTLTNANSTAAFLLSGSILNSQGVCGHLRISNMNNGASLNLQMNGQSTWNDTVVGAYCFGEIGGAGFPAINALRFQMSSGNLSVGTITLWGMKTS